LPAFLSLKPKSTSILELIEKVPEGKGILDAINLQIKIKGDKLDRGQLLAILKVAKDNADRTEKEEKAFIAASMKECETDLKTFAQKVLENQKLEFTVGRHTSNNERAGKSLQAFIDRTNQEKSDYADLSKTINLSWTKWKAFQDAEIKEIELVRGLLKKARDQIRKLGKKGSSLIQTGENSEFFTNLNEIKVTFESTFVQLEGFRPVITKLLELMGNVSAVNKEEVRLKLIVLFRKIRGQLKQMGDEVEASKASQDAIFTAILESYKENLIRIDKLLARLNKENKELLERSADLKAAKQDSTLITSLTRDIFHGRKTECIEIAERITKLAVEIEKRRNIVAQIAELLESKFGKLKSYFLERDMTQVK